MRSEPGADRGVGAVGAQLAVANGLVVVGKWASGAVWAAGDIKLLVW